MKQKVPPRGLEMDEMLEKLKFELDEERRINYLKRFGALPEQKEQAKTLNDFN